MSTAWKKEIDLPEAVVKHFDRVDSKAHRNPPLARAPPYANRSDEEGEDEDCGTKSKGASREKQRLSRWSGRGRVQRKMTRSMQEFGAVA